jgi:hypothetical protein
MDIGDIGIPEPPLDTPRFPLLERVVRRLRTTEWETIHGWHSLDDAHYHESRKEMQIYASHIYRRALTQALKLSNVTTEAVRFTPEILDPETDLDPFMMTSAFAWQIANHRIRNAEIEKAAEEICHKHAVDKVRNVKLRMTLAKQRVRAVYFPAYVQTYVHGGRQYRLLVNGYNGQIGGDQIKSPLLLGSAAAALLLPLAVALPPTVSLASENCSFLCLYARREICLIFSTAIDSLAVRCAFDFRLR